MPLNSYSTSQPALYRSPDDPSTTEWIVSIVRAVAIRWAEYAVRFTAVSLSHRVRTSGRRLRKWRIRDAANVPNAFIVLWIFLLWWGEKWVFKSSVESCHWKNWEHWGPNAEPHHLALVADPQLVDPHTYPGRPWPLSTLTVQHTDLYMYRSYSLLQRILEPDTVIFLGDLFDGGREWSTLTSKSPEAQYRSYGNAFWYKEFDRFARMFFNQWKKDDTEQTRGRPQKIIASLPGNHDLGLGVGIQLPVRDRFVAFFGDGNRVDVVGNHSFVSVDTVSLSAFGQADPKTSSQGSGLGDGPQQETERIWKPAMSFLDNAKHLKQVAVQKELAFLKGVEEISRVSNEVTDLPGPRFLVERQPLPMADLPTVLLTHVPLYRSEGTPCGPLREHWPPSPPPKGQTSPLEKDDRNAIAVRGGYQYQNVLTPGISKDLLEKIGNVGHVFSGDDHDYCEVVHKSYTSPNLSGESPGTSGIREITVKSISWAMGVRKPGFLMVSLWNPIDSTGQPMIATDADSPTLKTHLCLLPDQLSIFIRYAVMVTITLLALLVRAITVEVMDLDPFAYPLSPKVEEPLLPVSKSNGWSPSSAENEKTRDRHSQYQSHSQSSSNSSQGSNSGITSNTQGLFVRPSAARTRSLSPAASGYGIPASQISGGIPLVPQSGLGINFGDNVQNSTTSEKWSGIDIVGRGPDRTGTLWASFRNVIREAKWSIWRVVWVVLLWYFWLARNT